MTIKSNIMTVEDYLRRYQPKLYRAKEMKHAAAMARAAELARLEAQGERRKPRTKVLNSREQRRQDVGRKAEREAARLPVNQRNRAFCEYMQRENVPVDPKLTKLNVLDWRAAQDPKFAKVLRRIRFDLRH